MKNKATLLLHSFDELISCLTDEEAGRLIKAILDYDIRGTVTEFEDRSLRFLYIQIRNTLDIHKSHYKKVCNERKKSAEKRWHTENSEAMQLHANAYNINTNINSNEKEKSNSNENMNMNETAVQKGSAEGSNTETHTHKKAYGQFNNVYLTDEEYNRVCRELPDGMKRLESFSAYIASTGKTYANYYARLINWNCYSNGSGLSSQGDISTKDKKPPGERREPTFDVSAFTRKALNPVYVPPEE